MKIIILFLLLVAGCTKRAEKPKEILNIEASITKLDETIAGFDDKIKKAAGDPGLENRLIQDKELAKARAERMKKMYEQKTGTTFAAPKKEEGD